MTFSHGYALLIGVGESTYPKLSLPVTVKDMQAVRDILADEALCAYPEEHIRVLHDQGATRQAILDNLAWLKDMAAADPNATVMVYYSGHGWLAPNSDDYYLLQHDIEPLDLRGSALPAADFTAALHQISAQRLLVILDCCHAEGMATAKDGEPVATVPAGFQTTAIPKGFTDMLKQGAGRVVFTSSRGQQFSWVRADGQMSLYTYHLIEALQGAGSHTGDTTVQVSHLIGHLGKTVPVSARQLAGAEQTPFFDAASEDFPIALLRGGKGLPKGGWQEAHPEARQVIERKIEQHGKYNIFIERASGLAIGDQARSGTAPDADE
jgi:uncharacterized caspase-like protein